MKMPKQTAFNRKHRAVDISHDMLCISHDNADTEPLSNHESNADAIPDKTAGSDHIILSTNTPPTDHMPPTDHNEMEQQSLSPLYEGSSVSATSAGLLLKSFAYRHHISGQAQADLLQLLHLLLPDPNNLPKSLYMLHKEQESPKGGIVRHFFCSQCFTLVPDATTCIACPNSLCQVEFKMNSDNFFIELPVEEQLKMLLSRMLINHAILFVF